MRAPGYYDKKTRINKNKMYSQRNIYSVVGDHEVPTRYTGSYQPIVALIVAGAGILL